LQVSGAHLAPVKTHPLRLRHFVMLVTTRFDAIKCQGSCRSAVAANAAKQIKDVLLPPICVKRRPVRFFHVLTIKGIYGIVNS